MPGMATQQRAPQNYTPLRKAHRCGPKPSTEAKYGRHILVKFLRFSAREKVLRAAHVKGFVQPAQIQIDKTYPKTRRRNRRNMMTSNANSEQWRTSHMLCCTLTLRVSAHNRSCFSILVKEKSVKDSRKIFIKSIRTVIDMDIKVPKSQDFLSTVIFEINIEMSSRN